jgi:cellulose synthase/poly-beta-1,6-N-acetylglucosamine synthase-like glycosyltransferase
VAFKAPVSLFDWALKRSLLLTMDFVKYSASVVLLYLPFGTLIYFAGTRSINGRWSRHAAIVFQLLFVFRYYRLLVGIIGWLKSRPVPLPLTPTLTPNDVTVIIPSVGPFGAEFTECIESICANLPREIFVVVPTTEASSNVTPLCVKLEALQQVCIQVMVSDVANKRKQVCFGLKRVVTKLVASADDHVFWPERFLEHAIAPFENSNVALVGTTKHVRRSWKGNIIANFSNFLGCLYLERHNFEILSSNAIDGGVFVVPGRTALYRTSVVQESDFISDFVNERFFFGIFGPLNADDDNFITRWVVRKGYDIVIQSGPNATIETMLGEFPKFFSQCLR